MPESQASAPIDQGIFLLHRNKGKEFFQRQQLVEAAGELEAALRIHPDDDYVLNTLGMVYFKQNRLEEAKEVYNRLIAKNPRVYSLHSNIGLIYLKQNQYAAAERHFVEGTHIEPNNSKARMYLGLIYEKQQKYLNALQEYRLAGNEKMVTAMQQLLQKFADRGEPLPVVSEPPPPLARRATDRSAPVLAVVSLPPSAQEAPRPAQLPESAVPAATPDSEGTLRMPRVLPDYMKQTDFFHPERATQAEEQINAALDRVLGAHPAATSTPDQATLTAPSLQTPKVDLAPTDSRQPLNLTELTQPSLPHIRFENDDFRILNKNYLQIDFAAGLVAAMPRLIGAGAAISADPYAGVDGLIQYEGPGRVLLYEDRFRIHLAKLSGEYFYVKPGYVLALHPGLKVLREESALFRFLRIEGEGVVALAVSTVPVVLEIDGEAPLLVDASYLAALSTLQPLSLNSSKRAGFVEVKGRGSALLFPSSSL